MLYCLCCEGERRHIEEMAALPDATDGRQSWSSAVVADLLTLPVSGRGRVRHHTHVLKETGGRGRGRRRQARAENRRQENRKSEELSGQWPTGTNHVLIHRI